MSAPMVGRQGAIAREGAIARLIDGLAADGFAVEPGFVDAGLIDRLDAEARALVDPRAGIDGGVGRAGQFHRDQTVRRSRIRWLDGATPAQRDLLALAEDLRRALNERLYLGLFEFEAQFALYEPGGFYARHRDALAGQRNRVVSLIIYCNRDWGAEDGGELIVWRDDDGPPAATVWPHAGTLVLMLAEDIPHEARPARRQRTSVAGWFRVNASTPGRPDPAR